MAIWTIKQGGNIVATENTTNENFSYDFPENGDRLPKLYNITVEDENGCTATTSLTIGAFPCEPKFESVECCLGTNISFWFSFGSCSIPFDVYAEITFEDIFNGDIVVNTNTVQYRGDGFNIHLNIDKDIKYQGKNIKSFLLHVVNYKTFTINDVSLPSNCFNCGGGGGVSDPANSITIIAYIDYRGTGSEVDNFILQWSIAISDDSNSLSIEHVNPNEIIKPNPGIDFGRNTQAFCAQYFNRTIGDDFKNVALLNLSKSYKVGDRCVLYFTTYKGGVNGHIYGMPSTEVTFTKDMTIKLYLTYEFDNLKATNMVVDNVQGDCNGYIY